MPDDDDTDFRDTLTMYEDFVSLELTQPSDTENSSEDVGTVPA